MASRTSFTSFKVNYDYKPVENDQIELKQGDVCFVQKPFEDPKGWLVGLNSRTKKTGTFPGTFCQILAENATLPLPPRPPRRKPTGSEKPKFYPINGHMVEKTNFTKPVWCQNCELVYSKQNPTNIYLFKVKVSNRNLEKVVRFVQS